MLGISQPHVDYVLKGVRNLSVEISHPILNVLNISLVVLKPCGIGVVGKRFGCEVSRFAAVESSNLNPAETGRATFVRWLRLPCSLSSTTQR